MNYTELLVTVAIILLLILTLRTLLWHLQNWQLREYRWDRLKSYFKTKQGTINLFNIWFFRGILPRPKRSGRLFMILGVFILIHGCLLVLIASSSFNCLVQHEIWTYTDQATFPQPTNWLTFDILLIFIFLAWERLVFFSVALAISLSKIPVNFSKQRLFKKAAQIIGHADTNLTKIMITGSFGKSSTKELLVHLLQQKYGAQVVLFNPENFNNEVAIARLIVKNRAFFQDNQPKRFFVCEVGAYKKGEIKTVCNFVKPHLGILTGLNSQHLDLFGSTENIADAKFELAEACRDKVFFNASSPFLTKIFNDRKITATKIPMSADKIEKKSGIMHTEFEFYGENFVLPWAGEFFVSNAILALECARETGIPRKHLPSLLKSIKPLKRALSLTKLQNSGTVLLDLYSANPDGVLSAIDHLLKFTGKKYFIGMPLLELGHTSPTVHQSIFKKLNNINVQTFWLKADYCDLGRKILGKNFTQISAENLEVLKNIRENMTENDVILLEGKIPDKVVKIFKD